MKIQWKKIASTTPGGKPFFYFANTPHGSRWIVWDRILKTWVLESNNSLIIGRRFFKNPESAKSFVERKI